MQPSTETGGGDRCARVGPLTQKARLGRRASIRAAGRAQGVSSQAAREVCETDGGREGGSGSGVGQRPAGPAGQPEPPARASLAISAGRTLWDAPAGEEALARAQTPCRGPPRLYDRERAAGRPGRWANVRVSAKPGWSAPRSS